MNSVRFLCLSLVVSSLSSVLAAPSQLNKNGWHVTGDPVTTMLVIRQDKLGVVIDHVRLRHASSTYSYWRSAEISDDRLIIETANPKSLWQFEAQGDLLKISTTDYDGSLIGSAPASKRRIPVRIMDTSGIPVTWSGTHEVANKYDGAVTQNPSFLPATNSNAMYFSLGQVDGAQFHSLFDMTTDTAIDLPSDTILQRDPSNRSDMRVTMQVPGNAVIHLVVDYYTKHLGVPFYVPFDDSHFKTAPMVWSSWTSYYEAVTEADIVKNADWLAANLKPYGFQYVQLDDGYDRQGNGEHSWIEAWDQQKFPHGPKWLTQYIKHQGLRAGLWLVPNAYAGAVTSHPGWYLRNKNGSPILDYATPTLDSTNPEVGDFLKTLFTKLDDWGFDYYKFDGEFAAPQYIPGVDRSKLFNTSSNYIDEYRKRLETIRQTLGPDRFIEGCPAGTPLNGIGFFNSYFNGEDLYNNWQGMYSLFSAINGNAFLNHIVVYVMPGEGLELGEPMTMQEATSRRLPVVVKTASSRGDPAPGLGTTLPEARTLVTLIALTGVAYPLASVMPELSAERVKLLKATMPTLPIFPMDLFSRGADMTWEMFKHTTPDAYLHNYPDLFDLKVNSTLGSYDVVGLTNWRSGEVSRELHPEQLGLRNNTNFLAFDFWNQKFLGSFKDRLALTVDTHDTRVVLIHPDFNRPQILGSSRHLTGSYSIEDVSWDSGQQILDGTSQAIPGEQYNLWIHVPRRFKFSAATANVSVSSHFEGDLLTLTFTGIKDPVRWQMKFVN